MRRFGFAPTLGMIPGGGRYNPLAIGNGILAYMGRSGVWNDTRYWVENVAYKDESCPRDAGGNLTACVPGEVNDRNDEWYNGDKHKREYWHKDSRREQRFAGATPTFKPQILANKNIHIKEFKTATNTGGVISGKIVTIILFKPKLGGI